MDPIEPISTDERKALGQRWSSERRLEEVNSYLKEMAKAGRVRLKLPDDEAKNWAWAEAKKHYPPLSEAAMVELQNQLAADKAAGGGANPKAKSIQADIDIVIPESWGTLPKTSSYRGEVDWARGEYLRAVRRTRTGRITIDLTQANPAPSEAAISILKWAAKNENEWNKGAVPKMLNVEGADDDADLIRQERKSIKDIEAVLEKMLEGV